MKSPEHLIVEHYTAHGQRLYGKRWWRKTPAGTFLVRRRNVEVERFILKRSFDIRKMRILEAGCGVGDILALFVGLGAKQADCVGLDLLEWKVKLAKENVEDASFVCANARMLPFSDASFDLVSAFTLFSSIPSKSMQEAVASDVMRVLAPNGRILLYDYIVSNPRNPYTSGVPAKRIRQLFPGCRYEFARITLNPALARVLFRLHTPLAVVEALERIPLLRWHLLVLIEPEAEE